MARKTRSTEEQLKFSIFGYGRMGHLVEEVLHDRNETLIDIIDPNPPQDRPNPERAVGWDNAKLSQIETGIVFVSPEAGYETTKRLLESGTNAIVGTTKFYLNNDGSLNKEMLEEFRDLAVENNARMLKASNFSIGMNIFWKNLRNMARDAANSGQGYKPVILEAHHTGKTADVSGTAKTIGGILLQAFPQYTGLQFNIEDAIWPEEFENGLINVAYDSTVRTGENTTEMRRQITYAHSQNKIPIVAVRHGDIPGTHRVTLAGGDDIINLDHIVTNRKIFANGAVESAYDIKGWKPGLYDITDRLGSQE